MNVSQTSPIKELFLLLGGLLGILILIYIVLGLAVDFVVMRLPPDLEKHLGTLFIRAFADQERTPADDYLQEMLDTLVEFSSLPTSGYEVHLIPSADANAVALPGGHIVVLSGLIDELESENELAFILAHELGHFADRDHLKGLGRGVVLTTISTFLVGVDSALTQFLMRSLLNVEMKFSQHQETEADLFALDLLYRRYGHIAGATDFFAKLAEEDPHGRLAYFFATHPYPQDRVETLKQEVEKKEYPLGEELPLDERITTIPKAPAVE